MNKKIVVVFFLTILVIFLLPPKKAQAFELQLGEELTYKVSWSFIRLGTLKLEIADTLTLNNHSVYHIKLHIDSNPVLFFVNIHSVYNSYIDDQFRLFLFHSNEKIDGVEYLAEYQFDYEDSLIHVNMTSMEDPSKVIIRDEPLTEKILDGSALIYFTRSRINSVHRDTVPTFFESRKGYVYINYHGPDKNVDINSLENDVPSYYVDGNVGMTAVAGLTGPFKGWFARDDQSPPLKAELKVFVGNVKLQLEDWKMWQPPQDNYN